MFKQRRQENAHLALVFGWVRVLAALIEKAPFGVPFLISAYVDNSRDL